VAAEVVRAIRLSPLRCRPRPGLSSWIVDLEKQQMRWTPRGAHLLLQVRTRVLNDQLADDFHRWYPGSNQTLDPVALAA
jgi:hypothetical protein